MWKKVFLTLRKFHWKTLKQREKKTQTRAFFCEICEILNNTHVERVFHWQFVVSCLFSVSLKIRACYITGQWGEFTGKNATYIYIYTFLGIFVAVVVVVHQKLVFLSFYFPFLTKYQIFAREYWPIRNRNRWHEIVSGRLCWRQSAKDCFSYLLVLPCFEVVLGLACLKLISMSSNFYFIFIMFEFY